jgi:mannose-6-phosphate isomerase-like protein (cupin superfamily)
MAIRIFRTDEPSLLVPMISSDARFVVWPGVGANAANMNYVAMKPGEENVPHVHEKSEDVVFIVSGRGSVRDHDNDVELTFTAGDAIFIPAGMKHAVRATGGVRVVSVGGPTPPDWAMLRRLGAEVDLP